MKILVTGGAGFIGSNLCKRLVREGHSIICLDNLYTGRKKNIEALLEEPNFQFVHRDVAEPIDYEGIDQIYNLACPASPVHYQRDSIKTIETGVLGAMNVLKLAVRTGARVLQASTSEVYGDPEVHPQAESYAGSVNPIGIRACYDESKRIAETLFFDYHRQRGADIKVVRIFNTYGPGMREDDGRVVSNFIVQALEGRDITIYGNGQQTRSFCYISDLIDGLISMMNSDSAITGPINLGNPSEFTMNQLAEMVVEMTGSRSKIIYEDLPQDDPKKRRPDITLAKSLLNWEPRVDVIEGIKKTIEYFSHEITENKGTDN